VYHIIRFQTRTQFILRRPKSAQNPAAEKRENRSANAKLDKILTISVERLENPAKL
jgi:hypothetical protein